MRLTTTCERCDADIHPRLTGPLPRFCSARCRNPRNWVSPRPGRSCATCRTTFRPIRRNQRYCSGRCGWKHRLTLRPKNADWAMGRRTPRDIPCIRCGSLVFSAGSRTMCTRCRKAADNAVPKPRRQRILAQDEWTCYLCKGHIPSDKRWPHPLSGTVDHVIPRSADGPDTDDNLRAAHWVCNQDKGYRIPGVELGMSVMA